MTRQLYKMILVFGLGISQGWAAGTTTDKKPGFYIDSFHILPEVQFTGYYDDNIYASEDREVEDYVVVTTTTLKVKSLWKTNSLQANAGYSHGQYFDNEKESYDDLWLDFNGRYELAEKTSIYGGAGYYKKHEGRDSKESTTSGDEPTIYDFWNMQLGVRHQIQDYTVRLAGTYDEWDFEDVRQSGAEGGILENDYRNRVHTGLGLRVSRGLDKATELYVQGMLNDRNYESLDLDGVDRDSHGYNLTAGMIRKFGKQNRIQVYLGGLYQEYEDFDSVQALDFGFNLRWYPSDGYKVTGSLTRTLSETTESNSSGYLYTNLDLQLDKRLFTNYVGYVSFDYGYAEYQDDKSWEENFTSWGIGLNYYMSPHVFLSTSYNYIVNDSEIDAYSYDKNLFLISFKAKLAP